MGVSAALHTPTTGEGVRVHRISPLAQHVVLLVPVKVPTDSAVLALHVGGGDYLDHAGIVVDEGVVLTEDRVRLAPADNAE